MVTVCGFIILAFSSATAGLLPLMIGLAVASIGGAPLVTLGTSLVIGAAPPEKAGSAAAVAQTANESGLAFGVAFLGSILTLTYHSWVGAHMPAGLSMADTSQIRDNIASALGVAAYLPEALSSGVLLVTRTAFAKGLDAVVVVSAVLLTCVAIAIAVNLGRKTERGNSAVRG